VRQIICIAHHYRTIKAILTELIRIEINYYSINIIEGKIHLLFISHKENIMK